MNRGIGAGLVDNGLQIPSAGPLNLPAGPDALLRGRRTRIDAGDHGVTVQNPHVNTSRARACPFVIQNRVHHAGNNREVALLQAPDHFLHNSARLIMARGFLHPGPVFVVDGLPVQAAGLGLPVLVAHGGPDFLEGVQIQLRSRLCKRGRCCDESAESNGATAF